MKFESFKIVHLNFITIHRRVASSQFHLAACAHHHVTTWCSADNPAAALQPATP